jgi:hypothetical protein
MIKISKEEFIKLKGKDIVPVNCDYCNTEYLKTKRQIMDCKAFLFSKDVLKWNWNENTKDFCTRKCLSDNNRTGITKNCTMCNKEIYVKASLLKKNINRFCSSTCSATYNNTHKTRGTRRSKLEIWLEEQLILKYPDLNIHFNRKDAINSELDFYIPSLNIAFELNGIFHYEPIYGPNQLQKIQNNDKRKFQACVEKGIELCIIDTSQQKYFKIETSQKFFNIIIEIIEHKLRLKKVGEGIEPTGTSDVPELYVSS